MLSATSLVAALVTRRVHVDQREARDHRDGDAAVSAHEVPVQRDVRDVDVVARGHAAGEPARDAVELHDRRRRAACSAVQITSIHTIAA